MNKLDLMKYANEVRKGILTAVYNAKSGHPGGSLSATEIYTYLYFEEMNINPNSPKKVDRDRFCSIERTCSSRLLFNTCESWILSSWRFEDITTCWILFTRTSRYETHSRCRYVERFTWTRYFGSCWHGYFW